MNDAKQAENSPAQISLPYFRGAVPKWIIVLFFGIVGFCTPALSGFIFGIPLPVVHDELSYLMAADTYAHGHLTNPTPASPEHFETFHVIVEPTFMAKYPPMQGLFLAAGQLLFGYPIFGVWISCGLAAASLFWMISVWSGTRWAIITTSLMILIIGTAQYWAQSYWGGMVAASGGALFLGAIRQLFKRPTVGVASIMTVGGIILINSRPFEGLLTMLPSLVLLAVWLLRDRAFPLTKKIVTVLIPSLAVASLALACMLYYNYSVTGNALSLPYSVHQRQYFSTPLFIFEPENTGVHKGDARLREFYTALTEPAFSKELRDTYGVPDSIYLKPVIGFTTVFLSTPYFFLGPLLTILIFIVTPILARKDKWVALAAWTILFVIISMSFATFWDLVHYAAPLMCCYYLLTAECLRYFCGSAMEFSQKRSVFALLMIIIGGSLAYTTVFLWNLPTTNRDMAGKKEQVTDAVAKNTPFDLEVPFRPGVMPKTVTLRESIEAGVEKLPGKFVAIVSYKNANAYDEIVFNRSDLANAKLIWTRDLGEEKNKTLFDNYGDRQVLWLQVSDARIHIVPGRFSNHSE